MTPAWHDLVERRAQGVPAEVELLTLLGFLGPEPIPPRLLDDLGEALADGAAAPPAADSADLQTALASLAEDGLLARADGGVTVDPELAAFLRARLDPPARERSCAAVLEGLRRSFPAESHDLAVADECAGLLPHLRAAVGWAAELLPGDDRAAWLRERGAAHLSAQDEAEDAVALVLPALAERSDMSADALTGTLHRTLSLARSALDEEHAAREDAKCALDIHLAVLGPKHREVVRDKVALATVLGGLGDDRAALQQLTEALELDVELDHPDVFSCMLRIAIASRLLGRADPPPDDLERARELSQEALELAEGLYGTSHRVVGSAHTSLGRALQDGGDDERARLHFERALEITSATYGFDHRDVAVDLSNLGGVQHALGNLEQARRNLEQALKIAEATLPINHRSRWVRHRKLAAVLQSMRDLVGAREHAERALEISERALGLEATRTAEDASFLAEIQVAAGDHRTACASYGRALYALDAQSDPNLDMLGRCAFRAGRAAREADEWGTALRCFARAVGAFESAGRPERVLRARIALLSVVAQVADELANGYDALDERDYASAVRDRAREAFDAAVRDEVEAGDRERLLVLARSCVEGDAFGQAEMALQRAASGLAEGGEVPLEHRQAVAIGWHELARAATSPDPDLALRAYESSLPLLEHRPRWQGAILHSMADIHASAGRTDPAIECYRAAVARQRRADEAGVDYELAISLHELGRVLEIKQDLVPAADAYQESLDLLRGLASPHPQLEGVVLHDIADVRWATGDKEEAVELYRAAAACKRPAGAVAASRDLAVTLGRLGQALEVTGRLDEALETYRACLDVLSELPSRDRREEAITWADIGDVQLEQGQPAGAATAYAAAVDRQRELGASGDPATLAGLLISLSEAQRLARRPQAAKAAAWEAAALYRKTDAPSPRQVAGALVHVTVSAGEMADADVALLSLDEAEQLMDGVDDAEPLELLTLKLLRRDALKAARREDEVRALGEEIEATLREALDRGMQLESPEALWSAVSLAGNIGAWQLVRRVAERAVDGTDVSDVDDAQLADVLRHLGRAYREGRDYHRAAEVFERERELRDAQPRRGLHSRGVVLHDLAQVERDLGETATAVEHLREAAELKREAGTSPDDLATTLVTLGKLFIDAGDADEAVEPLEEALRLTRADLVLDRERIAEIESLLRSSS